MPFAWSSDVCSRSEEHTSELQSHDNLVCRLLLEKKKLLNRKSTRLNSSHTIISYDVFCLKKNRMTGNYRRRVAGALARAGHNGGHTAGGVCVDAGVLGRLVFARAEHDGVAHLGHARPAQR